MVQLHVFFFPFMAHGHMLPILDMAKLFSSREVKATIITTHQHVPMFNKAIEKSRNLGLEIFVRVIKFPAVEVGLPEGCESADQITSEDMQPKFFKAMSMLQEPLEQLLQECRPHCLIADMFFPWANDAAAKFGIPRLFFHGSSTFALCTGDSLRRHKPYKNVSADSEPFVVPDLPHQIKITRGEVSIYDRGEIETDFTNLLNEACKSEQTCYGVVVNTFYELEPDYVDYYKNVLGRRAWHIGPILLCNKETEDITQRGKQSAIDVHECLKWLDSKKPNSVIYACFGSISNFTVAQLYEIAMALEASGQQFIWVVRECVDQEDTEKWFPEGFEKRMEGKGLIIKGWGPQVLILEHEAVGAFITHCGWNSTLEGVCAGVPMVTWPMFAEQFFNEKLVIEVLRTGVGVGAREWSTVTTTVVKREAITKAINRTMVEEEALEMRGRAKALKQMAGKAVEEGGSSHSDLNALIEELSAYHCTEAQV